MFSRIIPIRIIRRIVGFLICFVCNCCAHCGSVRGLDSDFITYGLIITVLLISVFISETFRLRFLISLVRSHLLLPF